MLTMPLVKMTRLPYVDELKGFAILLMVMGHVLAWFCKDYQVALQDNIYVMLLWRVIYSFHMPLFMFCSGLVFPKAFDWYATKNIGQGLYKRMQTLLLPFFITGGLLYLISGEVLKYWFLYELFLFCCLNYAIEFIISKIGYKQQLVEVVIFMFLSLLILHYQGWLFQFNRMPFIDIDHLGLYPYFCLGMIVMRFKVIDFIEGKNWIYTCALIAFCILTVWITIMQNQLPFFRFTKILLPIVAITACVYYFAHCANHETRVNRTLQNFGRHSLEIYLIHFFFTMKLPEVGQYLSSYMQTVGDARGVLVIQLVLSLIISLIIITLCYGVMAVIARSNFLSLCLLGRKNKD